MNLLLLWIELRISVEEERHGRLLHCDTKNFQYRKVTMDKGNKEMLI